MPRTAHMTKVHLYIPNGHLEWIKTMAATEDMAFAEMVRRCLHLGMLQLIADRNAFFVAVEKGQKAREAIEAEPLPS
jgi:hypothetical protein